MNGKGRLAVIIGSLLLIMAAGYLIYAYLYQDARNISKEDAAFVISAKQLAEEYAADMEKANTRYLNKTIAIKGSITSVSDSAVTLDSVVSCGFDQQVKNLNTAQITIKGRCIGYDELFNEVKLDQCNVDHKP